MNAQPQKGFKGWFAKLEPKQKQAFSLGAGCLFLLIIAYLFVQSGPSPKPTNRPLSAEAAAKDSGNLLMSADTHEMAVTGVARELDALKAQVNSGQIAAKPLPVPEAPVTAVPMDAQSQRELDALRAEVDGLRAQLPANSPPGTLTNQGRPTGMPPAPLPGGYAPSIGDSQGAPQQPVGQAPPVSIRTILPDGVPATPADPGPGAVKPKGKTYYIPSGSIFSGVLTTGLDAPTGRGASGQPIPVHIRVKHEAILPNRYSANVQEAFIVAAGYGDLASERAYLRASTFSMVLANGQVIDMPVQMSSVGGDGKAGIRGKLVSKQGAKVAGALFAGVADGVARAFSGGNSLTTSGGDQISLANAGQQGAYSGASSGLNQVAQYMLAQAEAQSPIIEIDAGRTVDFILLKGIEIPVEP